MKPAAGQAHLPSDEAYPLTVTLGHRYLIVEARDTRTIYDFDRLRIVRVALAARTFTDDSLYSDIGFRALEFQNRIALGTALQAAKLAVNPMEPALVEQLFSMSNPRAETAVDQRRSGAMQEFYWGTHRLMAVSDQTHELPADYQSEYWRFLRYYGGGHPKIYAALASLKGVPVTVTWVLTNMSTETRELSFTSMRNDADGGYSLEGLSPAQRTDDPFSALKQLGPDAAAGFTERTAATVKAREESLTQGHAFDALLANMAVMIMTGDAASTTTWTAQHREAFQNDDKSRALMASLNPKDPAAMKAAAQTLADLAKQPAGAGYMLEVFLGNTLLGSHDKAGSDHLLAALAANPYLLGAWKDLGGYYYQSFQADKAWACWDAARRVDPQHSMLKPVTEMEGRLRSAFPEFF